MINLGRSNPPLYFRIKMEDKKQTTTIADKKPKKNLRFLRDKDRQPVKGIFHFHELPGGVLDFFFKKWKGDQIKRYTLRDGEVYTIPLGVATHLNKNCWYPVHSHAMDANGKSVY